MEEKKLTDHTEINVGMMDKEVIKALEWALKTSSWTASVAGKEQNMFRAILDLINRQKDEIERLTEERDSTIRMNDMYIKYVKKNAELQKQVDELTEKHETNLKTIEELNTRNCALTYNSLERARKTAKDTAKEILDKAPTDTDADERFIHWLRERYGV